MKKIFLLLSVTVINFQDYTTGQFPKNFKTWFFQRGDAKKVYSIGEENNKKFLKAIDNNGYSEQVFYEFPWDIEKFPLLRWQWRANILPKGGLETDPQKNDSACGLYIIFGRLSGSAIKFVWSTTLPVGSIFEKKPGKMVFQVLDSGPAHLHQWQTHTINVPDIYQKLSGQKLTKAPSGIAFLTDGNATATTAACDYSDLEIIPRHPQ